MLKIIGLLILLFYQKKETNNFFILFYFVVDLIYNYKKIELDQFLVWFA
jgi:hypothetical protein